MGSIFHVSLLKCTRLPTSRTLLRVCFYFLYILCAYRAYMLPIYPSPSITIFSLCQGIFCNDAQCHMSLTNLTTTSNHKLHRMCM